jgi:hypothetical protein
VPVVFREVDELLLSLEDPRITVHLRTYWRPGDERAVLLGELADQPPHPLELLPAAWRRLARDVDPRTLRVFTFSPFARDPFRRHRAPDDVAGERVASRSVGAPGRAPGSLATWQLADGPAADVWPSVDYTSAQLSTRLRGSGPVRYAPHDPVPPGADDGREDRSGAAAVPAGTRPR